VNDAIAVEATGYALLTLFLVEGGGVTILQDQIVEWLNTMRMGNGGFISTVDTIVAMEALVRYSYNSRIKGSVIYPTYFSIRSYPFIGCCGSA
jgi:A-macroglobulin TED domain